MSSVGFCECAQTSAHTAYTWCTIPIIPHHSQIEEGGGFVTTEELRWQMPCQVASAFSFHLSLWGSEGKVHNKEREEERQEKEWEEQRRDKRKGREDLDLSIALL